MEELTKTVLESGLLVEDPEGYWLDGLLPSLAIPVTLKQVDAAQDPYCQN